VDSLAVVHRRSIGTVIFFSLLDPVDLRFVGPLELGRKAGYTIGFFFFWALAAASSALTCFLQRRSDEVNRKAGGGDAAA
jgi:hypothetical protein